MDCSFIHDMEAFLFDLDGCIYFGDVQAPGSHAMLQLLRAEGKSVFFVTNNSTQTAETIALRLNQMGLPAMPRQVIVATDITGLYIKEVYGRVKVKVVGSAELRASLANLGHLVVPLDSPEQAEVIVVGRDTQFHYDKLKRIAEEATKGAIVIGTNADSYHIGSYGEKIPETGALTAAVEAMIGKIQHIGKPEPYLFHYVTKKYDIRLESSVMIGDNFNTDIAGGILAGMRTIWVKREENDFVPNQEVMHLKPDLTVTGIDHLLELYCSSTKNNKETRR